MAIETIYTWEHEFCELSNKTTVQHEQRGQRGQPNMPPPPPSFDTVQTTYSRLVNKLAHWALSYNLQTLAICGLYPQQKGEVLFWEVKL